MGVLPSKDTQTDMAQIQDKECINDFPNDQIIDIINDCTEKKVSEIKTDMIEQSEEHLLTELKTLDKSCGSLLVNNNDSINTVQLLSTTVESLNNISAAYTAASKKSEFDVFGESVAAQLNNMPFEKAIELQLEIQQLISRKRLVTYGSSTVLKTPVSKKVYYVTDCCQTSADHSIDECADDSSTLSCFEL
ncbi:hypothetical protein O3M35_012033 [Rhynocoris fuscipes]|uniref:Uncharacterized protein n=1 Tax=Rhynocoris fuscipes TaxID=488301 RepID=A0AAW1CSM4_9HEMI